ncbi:MAG: C25 family cysteine peptidase [Candidatus Jordarchaeaceae archaeon]
MKLRLTINTKKFRKIRGVGLKNSLIKISLLIVLIILAVPLLFFTSTPNPWVPTLISQTQQKIQMQNIPTPVILKTNTTQYVIITPPEWANNANLTLFAEWKTQKGIPTTIINTTYIYSTYSGKDQQEQIRNFLKDAYDRWNIKWALLVGNTSIIPIRYFNIGSVYDPIPSDYYYAALNGSFDDNGNERYGELGEIDWIPEIYVGRLPASNQIELEYMINKTLTYEVSIKIGDWMQKAVFAGGQISASDDIQGWRIKNYIRDYVFPTELNMNFASLFYDSIRGYTNLTFDSFRDAVNNGCVIINLCSHGSPTSVIISESGGIYYTSTAATNANNSYMLPLVFASACSTLRLDDYECIGEAMIKNPNGGAISYIGATRTSFGGDTISDLSDSLLDALFFEMLLKTSNGLFSQRPGYALYQSKYQYYQEVGLIRLAQNYQYRQEFLEYILLGDPELPIWTGIPKNLTILLPETAIPGKLMQIRVQNDGGNPVGEALVCIQGTNYYHTYLTDTEGKITIPAPQTGNYSITVTKPNFLYNTTTLEVENTTNQPTTFTINAPNKVNPGDQFTINVSCNDPQGVILLELIITDFNKITVESVPMLNNTYSFTLNASYFNNNSMTFYFKATDSQGQQTYSDAQTIYVQNQTQTPIILALIIVPTENNILSPRNALLILPFLICATVAALAWPSKEQKHTNTL